MKNTGKRTGNAQLKREAIIKAAFAAFEDFGFEGAKIEAIAKSAKVGKGTIYLYFEDKERLFEATIMHYINPVKQQMLALAQGALAHKNEGVRQVMLKVPEIMQDNDLNKTLGVMLREGMRFPDLVQFYYREVIAPMLDLLKQLMANDDAAEKLRTGKTKDNPQYLFMPVVFCFIWNSLFSTQAQLDLNEFMEIHLNNCFIDN